jgi:phage-related protein
MGMNITDKVSEFTIDTTTSLKGRVTIPAEQLRNEKCRYTFKEDTQETTFLGRMTEVWDYKGEQLATLRTLDGQEQKLSARLYVVADEQQKPTDNLGVFLPTVRRVE